MRQIKKGSVDRSVDLYIIDSADGTPETGVLFNTAGMDLKYRRDLSAVVSVTEATLAALTTAHTDGGFLEIGDGVYRFDLPDAAWATGADHVTIFGTVTGMIVLPVTVQLVDFDSEDTVRLGLTALPNAAPDAAGGLPVSDAGGLDLDAKLANTHEVTAARMGALTDWINGGRLDLILDLIYAEATHAEWGLQAIKFLLDYGVTAESVTDKAGYSLSEAGAIAIADALLDRDMATGTDSGGRTPRNALRFLRNRWAISGTTLSVKKEDDSTEAWTATVGTDANAAPIVSNDPS